MLCTKSIVVKEKPHFILPSDNLLNKSHSGWEIAYLNPQKVTKDKNFYLVDGKVEEFFPHLTEDLKKNDDQRLD